MFIVIISAGTIKTEGPVVEGHWLALYFKRSPPRMPRCNYRNCGIRTTKLLLHYFALTICDRESMFIVVMSVGTIKTEGPEVEGHWLALYFKRSPTYARYIFVPTNKL
jgi:hypothetical protein